jgi:hypothetical protein
MYSSELRVEFYYRGNTISVIQKVSTVIMPHLYKEARHLPSLETMIFGRIQVYSAGNEITRFTSCAGFTLIVSCGVIWVGCTLLGLAILPWTH